MRLSPGAIGNALAWMVFAALFIIAGLVAKRLGFVGLSLLGLLTWLICTLASLDEKVPTWGKGVFQAAMERPRSAEERAATRAEHQAFTSPFRFYGRCGAFLAMIGVAGFMWQAWMHGTPG